MKKLILFLLLVISSVGLTRAQKISPEHKERTPNLWNKENKKESFADKLQRYEKEGHKIAVLIELKETVVSKKSASSSGETSHPIAGPDEAITLSPESKHAIYGKFNKSLPRYLNHHFKTKVFVNFLVGELPDHKKEDLFGKNFWDSKYKSVVKVTLEPVIEGKVVEKEDEKELKSKFKINLDVQMEEYFTKKDKEKTKTIYDPFIQASAYYGKSFAKTYRSDSYPKTLEGVEAVLRPLKVEELAKALSPVVSEEIDRMISKISN